MNEQQKKSLVDVLAFCVMILVVFASGFMSGRLFGFSECGSMVVNTLKGQR